MLFFSPPMAGLCSMQERHSLVPNTKDCENLPANAMDKCRWTKISEIIYRSLAWLWPYILNFTECMFCKLNDFLISSPLYVDFNNIEHIFIYTSILKVCTISIYRYVKYCIGDDQKHVCFFISLHTKHRFLPLRYHIKGV